MRSLILLLSLLCSSTIFMVTNGHRNCDMYAEWEFPPECRCSFYDQLNCPRECHIHDCHAVHYHDHDHHHVPDYLGPELHVHIGDYDYYGSATNVKIGWLILLTIVGWNIFMWN